MEKILGEEAGTQKKRKPTHRPDGLGVSCASLRRKFDRRLEEARCVQRYSAAAASGAAFFGAAFFLAAGFEMAAALALAVSASLVVGAQAQASGPLYGAWCNDVGDPALYIEADGLGFGEHRLCSWGKAPGGGAQHQTKVHCRQMSSGGANPVLIAEKSYDFSAVLISPGVLKARIGDGATLMTFTYSPCGS